MTMQGCWTSGLDAIGRRGFSVEAREEEGTEEKEKKDIYTTEIHCLRGWEGGKGGERRWGGGRRDELGDTCSVEVVCLIPTGHKYE